LGSGQHWQGWYGFYPRTCLHRTEQNPCGLACPCGPSWPNRHCAFGTKDTSCRLGRSLIFGTILRRSLNMCKWLSGASNQSGVNNGGSGLCHLQPVTLCPATDLSK
jgi:hypothetical protein